MNNTIRFVQYKRKREGRTNYRKRLKLLVSGSPRLIIRRTNKNIIVQVADYSENGDHVVVSASSVELKKFGWSNATGNLPAAYLTGLIAGKKALQKGVTNAIVDLGLQTPSTGSRLYSAVKGAIDAGLKIPCSEEAFPSVDRLKGKHIAEYSKETKKGADIEKQFDEVKSKILK